MLFSILFSLFFLFLFMASHAAYKNTNKRKADSNKISLNAIKEIVYYYNSREEGSPNSILVIKKF